MTIFIEKDSGTAARRRVPMRLFTSNGTAPDTGASDDSIIMGVNSATTIVPDVKLVAVHAAQGMYYAELSQSNVSVLGMHPVYHVQGDFCQHVANVAVVNSNPFSSLSAIAAKTYSGVTVGVDNIGPGSFSAVTIAGVTRVNSNVTIANADYSAVTVRPKVMAYSGLTVGAGNLAPATYSGVTVGVNNIAPAEYSGVTVGTANASAASTPLEIATAVWSVASGNYSALTTRVHPMTYSGLTVGIDNIAPATYSAATVGGLNDVSNIPSSAFDFSTDTVIVGAVNATPVASIADGVWDETQAGHRAANSFGLVLASPSLGSRTDGASTSVITLGSGETTLNDAWNGALINFLYDDGTILAGIVNDYTGSDQSVALRDPLAVAPSAATYWIVPLAASGHTVDSVLTLHDIALGTYSGVTFETLNASASSTPAQIATAVWSLASGNLSALTTRVHPMAYSGLTVGIDNIAAGSYSGVTTAGVTRVNSSVTIADADYSAVTVRPKVMAYSGLTVEVDNIAPATYSGVTVEAMNVSGVSTGPEIATEVWSTASGNLSALTVRVHPMDYSGLTVGAGRIKPDSYSGVTVETSNIAGGNYSDVTVRVQPMTYSGLTVGIDNIKPATYSGATFNVNVKQINDATLTGDGSTTSWGPA